MRHHPRKRSFWRAVAAAVLSADALAGTSPGASAQATPPTDRARGMVWDGLAPGPARKSVTATLRAPDGTVLGQTSGTGTRTMTVNGPVRGTYSLVMTGSSGSYTATVQHLP